jgi:hypothetical protein
MMRFRAQLACAMAACAACFVVPTHAAPETSMAGPATETPAGLHDFDFLVGTWRVRHRRLKERLANSHEWLEFDGACRNYPLMDGWANVDENVFNMPGGSYRGVGLRSFDAKTGQWAIWWLDGRDPFANLDPPVKGRFENGVGTFDTDTTPNGKPIRVRYAWSRITPRTAHWEQAFSADGGKTWETNWIMEFRRSE